MPTLLWVLSTVLILVGLAGIVLPVLPGTVLVLAGILLGAWIEDFRADVEAVRASGTPSMILHGTADNILPIDATARRFRELLPEAQYVEIDGAPHGLLWTHSVEVNAALRSFIGS